jgi:hypothetical protein
MTLESTHINPPAPNDTPGLAEVTPPAPDIRAIALSYRKVGWYDSEMLVGAATTERIRDRCLDCYSLDTAGVPVWKSRIWVGLLDAVLAEEAHR